MKKAVKTDQAPAAVGPYSQAIRVDAGALVFCSGQIAIDPATGNVTGENAADQTDRIMRNLQAVLIEAGSRMDRVVKCTVYLADIADFGAVNEVYGRFFESDPPARAAVAVVSLPKGVRVMIDAIATT